MSLILLDALNNLQNRLFNLKVVQSPKRKQFTLKDVSAHCTENDCWMVIKDIVYDLTEFMREVTYLSLFVFIFCKTFLFFILASGGSDIMLEYAGTDATMALC